MKISDYFNVGLSGKQTSTEAGWCQVRQIFFLSGTNRLPYFSICMTNCVFTRWGLSLRSLGGCPCGRRWCLGGGVGHWALGDRRIGWLICTLNIWSIVTSVVLGTEVLASRARQGIPDAIPTVVIQRAVVWMGMKAVGGSGTKPRAFYGNKIFSCEFFYESYSRIQICFLYQ